MSASRTTGVIGASVLLVGVTLLCVLRARAAFSDGRPSLGVPTGPIILPSLPEDSAAPAGDHNTSDPRQAGSQLPGFYPDELQFARAYRERLLGLASGDALFTEEDFFLLEMILEVSDKEENHKYPDVRSLAGLVISVLGSRLVEESIKDSGQVARAKGLFQWGLSHSLIECKAAGINAFRDGRIERHAEFVPDLRRLRDDPSDRIARLARSLELPGDEVVSK